jgi:transcriptional regulator with XRE-family HTH domain
MSALNDRIAKCRKLANLTQTDMAEKLNIKCSTYSQMERKGLISAERLFEMAKIFGVTPCYLFDETEPCREEKKNSLIPEIENAPTTLNQPEVPFFKKEIFVITKKEENLIKILRELSKDDYNKTMKFIEEMNRKPKK